ncbi:uncharacterized protein LOC129227505 [Uloborus diversus]|uniref:uncharacterized protein LOC129227505 n=1 Tax=Uloborus diversus TaxID=327109 RepID=UPI0024094BB8|nr:uncharacterized protein LOC129227505 [Uloborus diversus]
MGNVEMHELEPVRDDEREELDLSVAVDYKGFCKHINGEYSYKCLTELPQTITNSISLHERINLSFNCLTTLPAELPLRLPHLSFMNLSYNKISSLPDSIGLLFHLKELLLAHNCLKSIPLNLTRLVKLQKIDLSYNNLEELPETIGEMESLKKLNVANNNLTYLPKSLGFSDTIESLLAGSNYCESQPPQHVCDSGSAQTIKFLKQLASGKVLTKIEKKINVFPRVHGNVVQTSIPNADSARAQYVQAQTETMNTASRIRTPLLPPYDATQLHPGELRDRIIGLIYGAVIGDALGVATEFLSADECRFHYEKENLTFVDIIRDEHRVHWAKGTWTSNSDQMLLVLDSLLQWAGVVDELEFAKHLILWKKNGIPEIEKKETYILSSTINLVLQVEDYNQNPHKVAKEIHKKCLFGQANGTNTETKSPSFVDSGSLSRAIILGVPRFYDLSEVISNSTRICLATHHDHSSVGASVTLSVIIALMLQGKFSLEDPLGVEELINAAVQHGVNHIAEESVAADFARHCSVQDFSCIEASEKEKACHPFTSLAAAFVALRQKSDFKTVLSNLLMLGGYSSMNGCISGSLLGCKCGYSNIPKQWIDGLDTKSRNWLNCKINALLDMMGLP